LKRQEEDRSGDGPLASRDREAFSNQLRADALRSAEERLAAAEKDRKVKNVAVVALLTVVLFVPLPRISLGWEAQQKLVVVWLLFGAYYLFTHT